MEPKFHSFFLGCGSFLKIYQPYLQCYIWPGAPNYYLDTLQILQKGLVGLLVLYLLLLLNSRPSRHHLNVANLSSFNWCYLEDVHPSWVHYLVFLIFVENLHFILMGCMILLLPSPDVKRMSIWTVSFLVKLDSWIFCLQNDFYLVFSLMI